MDKCAKSKQSRGYSVFSKENTVEMQSDLLQRLSTNNATTCSHMQKHCCKTTHVSALNENNSENYNSASLIKSLEHFFEHSLLCKFLVSDADKFKSKFR